MIRGGRRRERGPDVPRAVLEEGKRVVRKGRKGNGGLWLGGNKTERAPNDSRGIWYVSELGRNQQEPMTR